ncbi:hypothetical protein CVD25_06035 [Bacillus canaveralius]|uniref:Uncharacterized protein n=1 Tax=Bacillus canaveralius TaxID=1403243 RepID=A0A2N5GKH8_9BACI|nr:MULTISPECIES: hypothetical protein [Bacillus]PLR80946.1 hypothetical protein CVD23_20025 [Bacillus sp. V33-4]PLR82033.1 hypothetical protein CU635_12740 [Bacillus canaveralius]PLR99419.1 hypothetical protein CVD25_06035 [Bacillus canaveralius]RSK48659.1 hypothetical protein EJA13_16450 [Bacillus canaveralius]
MAFRLFLLLTGFGLAVSGGVSLIIYLNLLATGLNLTDYLSFVSTRFECYLLLIGIIIISVSIYYPDHRQEK